MPAFVEGDSYTTQARVESLVQRGSFVDGPPPTHPSKQQVLDFMALRASEITATLARCGYPVAPPTISNSTVARLCDLANAYMAAGDAILVHDVKDEQLSVLAQALWQEGRDQLSAAVAYAEAELVTGGSVRTATATGGIAKADFTDGGTIAELDADERFSMRQRW